MDLDLLQGLLQQDGADLGLESTLRPRFNLYGFETLSSTNAKLWELVEDGAVPGTVVVADQQQSGRGQWGRQWQSLPGGLYLSLLLTPDLPTQKVNQLTLCSAWGIAQAFQNLGIPLQLKWPNDLILRRRKLGGILTETRIQGRQIKTAVVGVGVNWSNPVPESGIQLQDVLPYASHPWLNSLEALAAIILRSIIYGYQVLQTSGFQTMLQSYQDLLIHLGKSCEIDGCPGTILGISEDGELRVKLHDDQDQASDQLTKSEIYLKPGSIHLGYD